MNWQAGVLASPIGTRLPLQLPEPQRVIAKNDCGTTTHNRK